MTTAPMAEGEILVRKSGGHVEGEPFGAVINPGIIPAVGDYCNFFWGQTNAGQTPTLDREMVRPIWIPKTMTFDRIATRIRSGATGGSGAVVRLGIRNDTGGGAPGSVLLDAGTVDGTVSASLNTVTISQQLVPGIYWLSFTWQVSIAGSPQYQRTGPNNTQDAFTGFVAPHSLIDNESSCGYYQGSVSGALGSFTAAGHLTGSGSAGGALPPLLDLRRSA